MYVVISEADFETGAAIWLCWSSAYRKVRFQYLQYHGDRELIRHQPADVYYWTKPTP